MQRLFSLLTVLFVFASAANRVWALGEEHFGNDVLSDANYRDWPGIMPLINAETRVYHIWVNGNEHFYHRGGIPALNAALKAFAAQKADVREVVLRPGSGEARSFRGQKIAYDWELHLVGGIARHMTTLDKGDQIWRTFPVLSVYVGDGADLAKLDIPQGITLVGPADLKKRYTAALEKSSDKTVRGWGCGELASLDSFDDQTLQTIAARLKDEDNWVRLNAAGALSRFGAKAKVALDSLRDAERSDDKNLKDTAAKTIKEIESAPVDEVRERRHVAATEQIERFLKENRSRK